MLKGVRVAPVIVLLLTLLLVGPAAFVSANHEPLYKAGVDRLNPGEWEAHFVWLRSPYFNFLGEVWWKFVVVDGPGTADALFMDWDAFRAYRDGQPYEVLVEPQKRVDRGYAFRSGLTNDLPYFLVFRNDGAAPVTIVWAVFAELDWRRWQDQEPGPIIKWVPLARSPTMSPGDTWETALDQPGFYFMMTRPHIDTTGIIEVIPAPGPGPDVEIVLRDNGLHPEILRVQAATVLRWTNNDAQNTTVNVGTLDEGLEAVSPRPVTDIWWIPVLIMAVSSAFFLVTLWWGRRQVRR